MESCQQALDQWRDLDCVRFGDLCEGSFCKSKPPPCGSPGAPPCPTTCGSGEHPQPCTIFEVVDPATGCCFTPIVLPPPQCGDLPLPPCPPCFGPECPGLCPDGTPPPCVTGCGICPDGSTPAPPNCQCAIIPTTCPDGSSPPCPVTICTPCANGTVPLPPQCSCPCVAPQHPPPCGDELPGGIDGCCSGMLPKECAIGENPPPCNTGDSIDVVTGCCAPEICYHIDCDHSPPGTCAGWSGSDANLFEYILNTFRANGATPIGIAIPGNCVALGF